MWNDLEGIALLGSGQTSFIILTSFWFLNVLFAHLPLKAVSGLSKIQVTTCLYKYSWDSLGDFILFSLHFCGIPDYFGPSCSGGFDIVNQELSWQQLKCCQYYHQSLV